MLPYNTNKYIIVLSFVAFLLHGCGAPYPTPAPGRLEAPAPAAVQEPAAESPPGVQAEQEEAAPAATTSGTREAGEPAAAETRDVKPDYADIEFVENRLEEYENKFRLWLEISEMPQDKELEEELAGLETECVQKLQQILTGYSRLLENMQQRGGVPSGESAKVDPEAMERLDISFLESRCGELLAMDIPTRQGFESESLSELSFDAAQKIIASQMAQRNYQEALFAYGRLIQDFPERAPSLSTRLQYGLALQYTGQAEAAAQQFQNLLDADDTSLEPLSLQRRIADLLLAAGDVAAAESRYGTVIDRYESLGLEKRWAEEQLAFLHAVDPESAEMIAYMNLLHEFSRYDYRIDAPKINDAINNFVNRYSGTSAAVSALRLKNFAVQQLQAWFDRQLTKIDALVAEKKYSEAGEILKNMTRYYLPAELQAVVQKTYYEVAQEEIQATEDQRRIHEMELSQQWDTASELLDSQQYDSAIAAFETLLGTEYEEQAKIKITEAANLAASQMRKEAASLFIRVGKTSDPEQKKELLLASHKLLTDILVKYPQTDLLDKVQQNIAILEMQMRRFDPALLDEVHQENPATMPAPPAPPFSKQYP